MTTTAKIEELQKSVINAINNSCLHPAVVRLALLNVISMVEASEREVNKREKRDRILKICFCSRIIHTKYKAIPHNSKCRYGERGAADAKPKAQIILDAAKVSAASGGNSEPKQGQRSQSARGFAPEARCGYRNPTLSSILATQMPCRSRRSGA